MSTLESYQYSNNTTILCTWAWERCKPSLWKWLQKKSEKEKKWYLVFNFPLTRSSQQRKTAKRLQNSDEKQYCQYWILRLVVFTWFRANRHCLFKLYVC